MHILLDFPELYWGNTGYRGYPAAFRLEDWGLSWDDAGTLGDRRWGRNYHVTVRLGVPPQRPRLRRLEPVVEAFSRPDAARPRRVHDRACGTSCAIPSLAIAHARIGGSYGTIQKTSYLILLFVFVPLMILTGIAQAPGFAAAMPALLDLFGGRQSARTLHTIGTVVLVLFVVVHVLEVAAAGFLIKVRSMITGK